MRGPVLAEPEKTAGLLPDEKLQLDNHFSLLLTFKCETMCPETKQSSEMRSDLKNSINMDKCSDKFRQNLAFSPSEEENYELVI